MFGLIVKMTVIRGRREEMIEILKESASNMAGMSQLRGRQGLR
jgi:hypothetical protein